MLNYNEETSWDLNVITSALPIVSILQMNGICSMGMSTIKDTAFGKTVLPSQDQERCQHWE